jgi:hypothetical protein
MTIERAPENPFLGKADAEETDQRLVAAAVGGDREVLEALVRRTSPGSTIWPSEWSWSQQKPRT